MRQLDNWLQAYMQYTMYSEAPEEFHFWTGVSVIAAALRRKVWFDMLYWEWTPNFYIIFVAPPGIVNKSTTINIGQSLIREVDGVKFGPSAITWQALIQVLSEAQEMVLLPDGLYHPMCCLSFYVSEFGTLFNPQDRQMVDVFVDMWDGKKGVWDKHTIMRQREKVFNPWVNVLACTTPSWLSENLPRSAIGGGFASRCIFVFATEKRSYIAYPKRMISPDWIKELGEKLLHDLREIAGLSGEYIMEEDAFKLGEEWYERHWREAAKQMGENDDLIGYMARKQAHVHKLAMVLSAAKRSELIITREDLAMALAIAKNVEASIPQVFHKMTTTTIQEQAERVLSVIHQRRSVDKMELYQIFFHTMTSQEFNGILDSAIQAGYIREHANGSNTYVIWVPRKAASQAQPQASGGTP